MKMKLLSALIVSSSLFYATSSHALQILTLVNHFNDSLKTKVERNEQTVRDLPIQFTLHPGDQIKTRVLEGSEAYIGMDAQQNPKNTAFFGVDTDQFRGYIGQGIAYSWTGDQYVTVTFCTPQEYKKHNRCL